MGSTTVRLGPLGVTFAAVPMPDLVPEPEVFSGAVNYRQTCGGGQPSSAPSDVACTVRPDAGNARLDNVSAHCEI